MSEAANYDTPGLPGAVGDSKQDPLLDVILRGLETVREGVQTSARRQAEPGDNGSEIPSAVTICPLLYATW
jgi:hypothetical protein